MKRSSRNISLLALAGAVAGLFYLMYKNYLFSPNPFAIALQVAAAALMVWARITFGKRSFHAGANPTAGGLVTRGPYRYWRHPIYAAITYFVWAGVLSYHSVEAHATALAVTLCLAVRMILEEQLLIAEYPEYTEYARKTKRFIPYIV